MKHFSFCSLPKIIPKQSSGCNTVKSAPCEALRSRGHYSHSLGYCRYYGFIRPRTVLRYFWHFLTGSLPFGFTLQFWFSCSFTEPKQGSCCLYAVRCVPNSQVSGTLGLSRSLPFRFYRSKCYFRHLYNSSLALNSPAHTIRTLALQLAGYDLTLSLNTTP